MADHDDYHDTKIYSEKEMDQMIESLTAENEQLRKTLLNIASYGEEPLGNDGICPYGCDTPHIAKTALDKLKETSDE